MFKSLDYLFKTHVLRKKTLEAYSQSLGLKFNIAAFDCVGRSIYKRGIYEQEITDWILHKINFQENDVFIDVGANIGWYSILVDKHKPSCTKILSFEPDELNHELFIENIKLNNCQKIHPEKLALSEEKGAKKLYMYSDRNLGRHSLLPINDKGYTEIETTVLDQYWDENVDSRHFPRLIKIDTEGYEFQVLQGAKKLMNVCPNIIAEFSPHFMKQGGSDPSAFLDFMGQFNYTPHLFLDKRIDPVDRDFLNSVEKSVNVLWMKL